MKKTSHRPSCSSMDPFFGNKMPKESYMYRQPCIWLVCGPWLKLYIMGWSFHMLLQRIYNLRIVRGTGCTKAWLVSNIPTL